MLELLLTDTKARELARSALPHAPIVAQATEPHEPFRTHIAEGLRLTARIETRVADRLQPRRATTDVRCR